MSRKAITEKDGVHKEWYKEAKDGMSMEKLPAFLKKLTEDYEHDYGTICHAMAASAVATMWAVDRTEQGGVTGFQASAIMWELVRAWGTFGDGPKRMVCYDNMLYPQYANKFRMVIDKNVWKYLQEEAAKHLSEHDVHHAHPDVMAHWQSIMAGKVPFGYTVEEDDD